MALSEYLTPIDLDLLKGAFEPQREESIATRTSLLTRLKDWNDQESWNSFFSVYWKLIYVTAIEAGLTDDEAQEAVQDTVISVCKAMPTFEYDRKHGSFKAWLLQLTSWRIKDQLRKRIPSRVMKQLESEYGPVPPELEERWNREWDSNLLHAAVERVRRRIDPRQFQLFDAYVIQQWPTEKIRLFLNAGRGQIYVAKHRVASAIRKEYRKLQRKCI